MQPQLPVTAIFGATGFIGRHLFIDFSNLNPQTLAFARKSDRGFLKFDLARPDIASLNLRLKGVTHAIIASAVTGIGACEKNPEDTRRINVDGVVGLAGQLSQEGIKVTVFSSDYVFDGVDGDYDEYSTVNPLNEYGRQKAEVEARLPKVCSGNYLILRLSKVFDLEKGSGTLLDEMSSKLTQGFHLRAARDQIFCPTYIGDIVNIVRTLVMSESNGLINVCSPEKVSRLNLVQILAEVLDADSNLIEEISISDLGENFNRPKNTSMVSNRLDNYIKDYRYKPLKNCIDEMSFKYKGQG